MLRKYNKITFHDTPLWFAFLNEFYNPIDTSFVKEKISFQFSLFRVYFMKCECSGIFAFYLLLVFLLLNNKKSNWTSSKGTNSMIFTGVSVCINKIDNKGKFLCRKVVLQLK